MTARIATPIAYTSALRFEQGRQRECRHSYATWHTTRDGGSAIRRSVSFLLRPGHEDPKEALRAGSYDLSQA